MNHKDKYRIAVVGYGNIGRCLADSVLLEPDMELAGIVRRDKSSACDHNVTVTEDISNLGAVDVALLAVPSRSVRDYALKYLDLGINTVDSFDIHKDIYALRAELDDIAKQRGRAAILSAGWDPGSDSVIRALMLACAPRGITYTNFGPGMSMGHTVAAKAIQGVAEALSITIPLGTGLHRRMVYVRPEDGADMAVIRERILNDPYFSKDDTRVIECHDISSLTDQGHGVNLVRRGASGSAQNQIFEFNMRVNNPALTAQIMVSAARASMRQKPGAYTLIEIPVIDMLFGERNELIKNLV